MSYVEGVTSIACALISLGVTQYSSDLVYTNRSPRFMNDSRLDHVEEMSYRNVEIFKAFKKNVDNGLIPPLKAEYDEKQGKVAAS